LAQIRRETMNVHMKLTVLGSGTSVPHPRRSSPAFWLDTNAGSILLDFGPDAAHRMAQERLDWPNLDVIWISHFHLDHFGGLVPFLFSLKWSPQTQGRTKSLKLVGPRGLKRLLETINDANNYQLFKQSFEVVVNEIEPNEELEILPDLQAITLKTKHNAESLALRLTEEEGKIVVYTSDTGFTDELTTFAANADVLLLECSFIRNKPLATHLELIEAITIAEGCRPRKLVLTHLYPEWDEVNVVAEAKALWQGDIVEATDGLVLRT
jgi:ribonuclease BN (tRNA processing enzyme)